MPPITETGHARNAANLATMNSRINGFGIRYNPSNSKIKLPGLLTLATDCSNVVQAVNAAKPAFISATNARQIAFEPLDKLATRILNALDASENVPDSLVEDARTIVRKIRGARKTPKASAPAPEDPQQISASQQSYDMRLDNYDKLLQLVAAEPLYLPNEAELKTPALTTFKTNLTTSNNDVISATTPYLNAIIARNSLMYSDGGMIDRALEAKKYAKSVQAITKPEFKLISSIAFKRLVKK